MSAALPDHPIKPFPASYHGRNRKEYSMVLATKRDVDLQRDVIDELQYDPEIDAADIGVTGERRQTSIVSRCNIKNLQCCSTVFARSQ